MQPRRLAVPAGRDAPPRPGDCERSQRPDRSPAPALLERHRAGDHGGDLQVALHGERPELQVLQRVDHGAGQRPEPGGGVPRHGRRDPVRDGALGPERPDAERRVRPGSERQRVLRRAMRRQRRALQHLAQRQLDDPDRRRARLVRRRARGERQAGARDAHGHVGELVPAELRDRDERRGRLPRRHDQRVEHDRARRARAEGRDVRRASVDVARAGRDAVEDRDPAGDGLRRELVARGDDVRASGRSATSAASRTRGRPRPTRTCGPGSRRTRPTCSRATC